MTTPEDPIGQGLERQADLGENQMIPIDPQIAERFALVGLTPDFPIRLRRLNDVLSKDILTQFGGFSLTLSPGKDDPITAFEVKKGIINRVVVDIDRDYYDPSDSRGKLTITSSGGSGEEPIVFQNGRNLRSLVRELYPDTPVSLIEVGYNHKAILDDNFVWGNFRIPETATGRRLLLKPSNTKEPFIEMLALSLEWSREQLLWVSRISYSGKAPDLEKALDLIAAFCNYDPQEDSTVQRY